MRIKCRGYYGKLLSIEANENAVQTLKGDITFNTAWYDIEIRTDDDAKVCLSRVKEREIHIEQSADD